MRKITDQIGIDRKTTYQMIAKDFIKIDFRLVQCKRPWISWLSHKDMLTRALIYLENFEQGQYVTFG